MIEMAATREMRRNLDAAHVARARAVREAWSWLFASRMAR